MKQGILRNPTFRWLIAFATFLLISGAQAAPKATRTPSADECKTLGMSLAHSLTLQRPDELFNALDTSAVLDRALEGLPGANALKQSDRKEIEGQYIKALRTKLKPISDVEFIRFQGDNGEARVLLRLLSEEDGDFDYWYLTIAYTGTTTPRIVDIYSIRTGENVSATFRRNLIPELADLNKSMWQKVTGVESEYVKHRQDLSAFSQAMLQQKYPEVLAIFKRLPKNLQNDKSVQIMRLTATANVNIDEFIAAMADYRRMFPKDPSVLYYSYYARLVKKQIPEALANIDGLEKEFGPDKFLDYMRARTYDVADNHEQSLVYARKSLDNVRSWNYAGRLYFVLTLMLKKFDESAQFLREVERDQGTEMYAAIRNMPTITEFRGSDAFRKWMESPVKKPVDPAIKPQFLKQNAGKAPAAPKAPAPVAVAPVAEAPKIPLAPYKLGGILYSKTSPATIINGKTLYVGDRIGEAKVVKIEPQSVTLDIGGKTEVLSIK
jgi:tetratricopeptide (TPR) repeat protein